MVLQRHLATRMMGMGMRMGHRAMSSLEQFDVLGDGDGSRTQIEGYDNTGFLVNGVHLIGDILALPHTALLWRPNAKEMGMGMASSHIEPTLQSDVIVPDTLQLLKLLRPNVGM